MRAFSPIILILLLLLQPAGARPLKATEMVQFEGPGDLFGPSELHMSSLGIRIKSKVGYIVYLTRRPDAALLINPENHTYLWIKWKDEVEELHAEYPPLLAKRAESKKIQLLGHRDATHMTYYGDTPKGEAKTGELDYVRDIELPPSIAPKWSELLFAKPELGTPVALSMLVYKDWLARGLFKPKKTRWLVLVEPKPWTVKPLNKDLFEEPKGYHQAKDKAAFYLSSDGTLNKDDLNDLFRAPLK